MRIYKQTASIIRPNDLIAYTSGDLVANSTTAGSVTPFTFTMPLGSPGFLLTNVKLTIAASVPLNTTNRQYTLWLYQLSPVVTNGDNGAFISTEANFLGNVYLDATQYVFQSSQVLDALTPVDPNTIPVFADTTPGVSGSSNQIYGLLQATPQSGGINPSANELYIVTLVGID